MIPTWKNVILKSLSLTIPRDDLLPVGNLTLFVNDHSLNSYIIHTCRLSFGMMPQSLLTKYPDFWNIFGGSTWLPKFFFTMHWGSFSTRISTHILHHCWLHAREIYILTGEIHKSTIEIPSKSRLNPMKSQFLMGQIRKKHHFGWIKSVKSHETFPFWMGFAQGETLKSHEKSTSSPAEIPSKGALLATLSPAESINSCCRPEST